MNPIEFTEKEIEKAEYRLIRAKKKANTPQSELDNILERIRVENEILDILKRHFDE